MQLAIPIEVPKEAIEEITKMVYEQMSEQFDMMKKVRELPEYPSKVEVMEVLGIGYEKLNEWIAMGLKVQVWSNKNHRIEREELKRFLRENFER
ncbi:helix-turn-helix domain-containing protein [Enterococcus cecorum]|nr:helix-turn-helix domain-containing protein [Enterococcus cecorum]